MISTPKTAPDQARSSNRDTWRFRSALTAGFLILGAGRAAADGPVGGRGLAQPVAFLGCLACLPHPETVVPEPGPRSVLAG